MEIISTIAPYVPQYAWPLLILALGYAKIQSDRKKTREVRDADSTELHDKILKHDFLICQLKDNQTLHNTLINDLRETVNAMNVAIAKLDTTVANLNDTIRNLRG
jgi:hypothetical protein